MPRLSKCDICGREKDRLQIMPGGKKICTSCYDKAQDDEIINELDLSLPQNVVWIGKVAKMGNARAFFIPKSQRAFLRLHQNYFIIIKEVVVDNA